MLFSRAIFAFFAVGAISAFAAPSPGLGDKDKDDYDVIKTLDVLEQKNDAIIPQIGDVPSLMPIRLFVNIPPDALIDSNKCNESNLLPLLQTLVYNVDTTTGTFKSYKGKKGHGGSKDEVSKKAAKIIQVGLSHKTRDTTLTGH